jgi:DNA-binding MarR family transcriptional regulator
MPAADPVDALVDQWRVHRPDLDLAPMATLGRLGRFSVVAGRSIEAVFNRHGLSTGEFDVLAALRRGGEPHTATPTQLTKTLMLSAAGMTNRLDRLEAAGFVERRHDPDDRRSWLVVLTKAGFEVVDRAVEEHVANEARLLAPLTSNERVTLDRLLRKLLTQFDDARPA